MIWLRVSAFFVLSSRCWNKVRSYFFPDSMFVFWKFRNFTEISPEYLSVFSVLCPFILNRAEINAAQFWNIENCDLSRSLPHIGKMKKTDYNKDIPNNRCWFLEIQKKYHYLTSTFSYEALLPLNVRCGQNITKSSVDLSQ